MKLLACLYFLATFALFAAPEVEENNSSASANPVVVGQITTGQLASDSDQDWFRVIVSSGGTLSVTFDSPEDYSGSSIGIHMVEVRSSNGVTLASVETGGDTAFVTGLSAAGTYYVVVRDGSYYDSSTGQYAITVSTGSGQVAESEPNGFMAQADSLAPGQKIFGQLFSESDQDWFSVVTSGPATLNVTFDSPEDYSGSSTGFHTVQVVNASGTVFANMETGGDVTFQAGVPSAGTYFVIVRDGPYYYPSLLQYGLTVTGGVAPDTTPPSVAVTNPLNNTTVSTATTAIGGSASDNVGVAAVYVQVNSNAPFVVGGTSSWSANVALAAGGNTILVYAVDAAGNQSAGVTRTITYTPDNGGGGGGGNGGGGGGTPTPTAWDSVGFTMASYGFFDASAWPWINHGNFGHTYVYQPPANGGFWIYLYKSKLKYAWISPSTMPRMYGYPTKASKLKVGWYSSRLQKGQRYILPPKSKKWIKDGVK